MMRLTHRGNDSLSQNSKSATKFSENHSDTNVTYKTDKVSLPAKGDLTQF